MTLTDVLLANGLGQANPTSLFHGFAEMVSQHPVMAFLRLSNQLSAS